MPMIMDGSTVNAAYLSNLDDANFSREGRAKIASFGQEYIRDRLYEECTFDKVIEPKNITPNDPGVQISLGHDTIYKLEFLEAQAQALTTTMRGNGPAEIIRADRTPVAFFTIMSTEIQKTEQELMPYVKAGYPLTKMVEDIMMKSMQELKDRPAVGFMEAAVQGIQKDANNNTATKLNSTAIRAGSVVQKSVIKSRLAINNNDITFKIYAPVKEDFVNVKNLFYEQYLEPEFCLMVKSDFERLNLQTLQDLGDKVASETVIDGWVYNKFEGLKILTTRKVRIYRPGNAYVFCHQDFVGRNYILNNMKFYVDKKKNVITWCAWFDLGMAILNAAAVKKIEFYGGSVVPTQTDTGFAVMDPFDESNLVNRNNRVAEGLTFPSVSIF